VKHVETIQRARALDPANMALCHSHGWVCSYAWYMYNTTIRLVRYTANYQFSSPLASPASETLSSGSTLVFPCEPSIAKAPRHVILFPVSRPPTRLPT
jgi:hypothetical protein